MLSKIANTISLKTHPVAILWSDALPDKALHFVPGRWGCVMTMMAAVATKGRTCVFSHDTYGCWGGGVGLGFGNAYEDFPGGVEGFCGFLAQGNDSDVARQIAAGMEASGSHDMADDFLNGECYLKTAEHTREFVEALPICEVPARYVVAKPLEEVDVQRDDVKSVTFFVEPDALSALVILANHSGPGLENVAMPWAAGCQVMGILAYNELEKEAPRALVGLTDISARKYTRETLGHDVMSFTAPWPTFLKMEANLDTAFFGRHTWQALVH